MIAGPLPVVLPVALTALALAMILAFIRLVRGPSLADRAVALDHVTTLTVGMVAVASIAANEALYLRVAIVLSLLAFAGTVAFARYIEKRAAE